MASLVSSQSLINEVTHLNACILCSFLIYFHNFDISFKTKGQHVYSVPDVMMFESNDLIYFHVIQPTKVSYVFKARPAQDFGDLFVSFVHECLVRLAWWSLQKFCAKLIAMTRRSYEN